MIRKSILTKRVLSFAVVTTLSLGSIYLSPSDVGAARRGQNNSSQSYTSIESLKSQINRLENEIKNLRRDKGGRKEAKLRQQIIDLENEIKRLENNSNVNEDPIESTEPSNPVESSQPEDIIEEPIEIPADEVKEPEKIEEDTSSDVEIGNEVDAREFGAKADANYYNPKDGSYYVDSSFSTPATDDTEAINKAIAYASENGIRDVYIPSGKYLINPLGEDIAYVFQKATKGGIQLESNISLRMSNDTTLVMNTVYDSGYALIVVNQKENVEIIGGNLVGDIKTHPSGDNYHNYCYGINIVNASKDVLVKDVNITQMEDDGIMIVDYLEHLSDSRRIENVEIRNVKSHGNGRQGLTISTGTNIGVYDSEFSNQKKHLPMSGIDIELESYDHIGVKDVVIEGNTFNDNAYSGIVFSDMFNDKPGSMSENVKISRNNLANNRFGVIVAGQVDGLEISKNNVKIDHMIDEFSAGLGSTSEESKNVKIEDNKVISQNSKNYSLGIINISPSTTISNNSLEGQRIGLVLYGEGATLIDNMIANYIDLGIQQL